MSLMRYRRKINFENPDIIDETTLGMTMTTCCAAIIFLFFSPLFDWGLSSLIMGPWMPDLLTIPEFRGIVKEHFVTPGECFKKWDDDHDKLLSYEEFLGGCKDLQGDPVHPEAAKHIFIEFDWTQQDFTKRGDQLVGKPEFCGLLGQCNSSDWVISFNQWRERVDWGFGTLKSAFEYCDSDYDVQVSFTEFDACSALLEPKVWHEDRVRIFSMMDQDDDGLVCWEEFSGHPPPVAPVEQRTFSIWMEVAADDAFMYVDDFGQKGVANILAKPLKDLLTNNGIPMCPFVTFASARKNVTVHGVKTLDGRRLQSASAATVLITGKVVCNHKRQLPKAQDKLKSADLSALSSSINDGSQLGYQQNVIAMDLADPSAKYYWYQMKTVAMYAGVAKAPLPGSAKPQLKALFTKTVQDTLKEQNPNVECPFSVQDTQVDPDDAFDPTVPETAKQVASGMSKDAIKNQVRIAITFITTEQCMALINGFITHNLAFVNQLSSGLQGDLSQYGMVFEDCFSAENDFITTTTQPASTTSTTPTVPPFHMNGQKCLKALRSKYPTPDAAWDAMVAGNSSQKKANYGAMVQYNIFDSTPVMSGKSGDDRKAVASGCGNSLDQEDRGYVIRHDIPGILTAKNWKPTKRQFIHALGEQYGSPTAGRNTIAGSDGKSKFSKEELANFMAKSKPPFFDDDVDYLYDLMDSDDSGDIEPDEVVTSVGEFKTLACHHIEGNKSRTQFSDADADGDLKLNETEFTAAATTLHLVPVDASGIFSRMDETGRLGKNDQVERSDFCYSWGDWCRDIAAMKSDADALYKDFDKDPDDGEDGEVPLADFLKGLKRLPKMEPYTLLPNNSQELKFLFDDIDRTGNGLIEMDEFDCSITSHGHEIDDKDIRQYIGVHAIAQGHVEFALNEPSVLNRPSAAEVKGTLQKTFDKAFQNILNYSISVQSSSQQVTPDNDMLGQNRTVSFSFEIKLMDGGGFILRLRHQGKDLINRIRYNLDSIREITPWMEGVVYNVFVRVTLGFYGPKSKYLTKGTAMKMFSGKETTGEIHYGEPPYAADAVTADTLEVWKKSIENRLQLKKDAQDVTAPKPVIS